MIQYIALTKLVGKRRKTCENHDYQAYGALGPRGVHYGMLGIRGGSGRKGQFFGPRGITTVSDFANLVSPLSRNLLNVVSPLSQIYQIRTKASLLVNRFLSAL